MRLPNRLRSLATAGLLAAAAGCSIGTVGEPAARLVVQVLAVPDTFAVGDSTLLTVTARNPGAEPVEFTAGDCGPLDVEIRLASGATILPGLVGCTAGGVTVVPAGREIAASVVWRGERGSPGPVVPGAYAVRGVVRTANGGLYGAPTPVWIVAP